MFSWFPMISTKIIKPLIFHGINGNIIEFIKFQWFHDFCGIPCPLASKSLIFLRDYRCLCEWPISAKTINILQNSRFRKNEVTLLGFQFFWKNDFLWKSARWRQTPLKVYRKALVIQCFARWGRAGPKDGNWTHSFHSEVPFFGESQEKCCGDWKSRNSNICGCRKPFVFLVQKQRRSDLGTFTGPWHQKVHIFTKTALFM